MESIIVISQKDKTPNDYIRIDVTSHNPELRQYVSPFYLGPIILPDGDISKNMENAWQFSKVYADMVDENKNPTEKYFTWRNKGFNDNWAYRHPHNGKPLYAWCNGKKLNYIESRKKLYIPLYCQGIMNKPKGLSILQDKLNQGYHLALADFDGYNHKALGMNYEDVLNTETKRMGHGFVLAMLLERPDLIDAILRDNSQLERT